MAEHAALGATPVLGAPGEGVHGLGGHHGGGHALGDRHVDVLPLTGVVLEEQGHSGSGGAVQSSLVLGLKATVLQGLPSL